MLAAITATARSIRSSSISRCRAAHRYPPGARIDKLRTMFAGRAASDETDGVLIAGRALLIPAGPRLARNRLLRRGSCAFFGWSQYWPMSTWAADQARRQLDFLLKLGPALMVVRGMQSAEVEDAYRRAADLGIGLGDDAETNVEGRLKTRFCPTPPSKERQRSDVCERTNW